MGKDPAWSQCSQAEDRQGPIQPLATPADAVTKSSRPVDEPQRCGMLAINRWWVSLRACGAIRLSCTACDASTLVGPGQILSFASMLVRTQAERFVSCAALHSWAA